MSRVLEVMWKGGCNNGAVKRHGALAEYGSHAFEHRARVWLDDAGTPRGAWWDDTYAGAEYWARFVTAGIPAALWELAQTEGREIEEKRAA
jgi:hypothetical protein